MPETPAQEPPVEPKRDPEIERAGRRYEDMLKRVGAVGGAVAALIVWVIELAEGGALHGQGASSYVWLFFQACITAAFGAFIGVMIAKAITGRHRAAFEDAVAKQREIEQSRDLEE